jgi:acetyltransferase-like isoleucine patch superfamily enzyme
VYFSEHFPRRIRYFITRTILNRLNIMYSSVPEIEGYIPLLDIKGRLILGKNILLRSFRLKHCITVLRNAEIIIGDDVRINDGLNICATKSITIGPHTLIGDMVYIYDNNFHFTSPTSPPKQASVEIGKNVWIASRVTILAGTNIGDHSVIGTGSVVSGDIPSRSLVFGSPAKVVKTLEVHDSWIRTDSK